jgi:phosphoribosyl 1,2-cyclic phosphate phosphodiesterase
MKITFLGTGTSQGIPIIGCHCEVCLSANPKDKRLRSSILIEMNDGFKIVIDTGPDFRAQMLENGFEDLDAVLFTHDHRDHTAGLDDIRPINFLKNKNIPLYATKEVHDSLKKQYDYIFENSTYEGKPQVTLIEISKEKPFEINRQVIIPIEVKHGIFKAMGFRFNDFVYITDASEVSEEEIKKLAGTKTLVVNALHQVEHYSHFNLVEALDFIKKINPERAYLTHVAHKMGLVDEVSKTLPKNVSFAWDGLQLEVDS